ncbi:DNA polymerase III subunit gamma/tau [Aliarcobacter skirrowii]|uniref:DNA polymerase III subunit gamma/tau n=1 Tax=Aliarcobacter skirrowii TaxID=28200 RepID=A0A2U2C1R6_9BACT|nr:DNA polymerase III subunit gamma/tau [Aliarcobacter skirrowii]PWE21260.1 DNA polymerase III subunit gamma/tau [Aliarcobacter skirrowii]PWE22273.1 DNA polymerase III subunit gamma/tau [Aliarcobacter skirrowii]PWE26209.1 DNA polymerase III subunit gamma/tau [Aliarcobacter skirrowii]RJO55974.1 DNA polymerase III subunit gamma/tau [Aliarcobacter skirrowii]RJO58028.1 DNA polymerase III subunit gamma/tau [Aliarcobacter skirrowii]
MSENIVENRVLALKYRPRRFEDLVGQTTISQTLSLALDSNRLSHAYLFSGLRGSGKTSTARIMAKSFLCEKGPTSKPCEVCEHCLSANSGRHLDIIEMDAASNRGIDDIKDLIEHTKYKPSSARFKVFIIDEVHMLTPQAFNALLKTLEEPPGFVKFILATTDALKLPATILSRTQHFRFNKISQSDVVNHISSILNKEQISFEKQALEIIAKSGQGSLRDTLTLLDQAIIFSKANIDVASVVDMLGLIDPQMMDKIFKTVLNKDDFNPLLEELQNYEANQILNEMTNYLKTAMLEKDSRFNTFFYERFFRIIGDSKQLLSLNSDDSFVLILTFMKLIEATNLKSIDEILNQVESIKPIPEKKVEQIIETKSQIKVETKVEPQIVQQSLEAQVVTTDVDEVVYEAIEEESDIFMDKYQILIEKLYDRSSELGECFERNFIYNGFENETLNIVSYAKDEDRNFLYKHFNLIKTFTCDIFGVNTKIDFKKDDATINQTSKPIKELNEVLNSKEEESFATSSGCVASSLDSSVESLNQKELEVKDLLDTKMINQAKELFDIKRIVVKPKI